MKNSQTAKNGQGAFGCPRIVLDFPSVHAYGVHFESCLVPRHLKMAPSLTRQRNSSMISLRSATETSSPCDDDIVVRTSASSVQSATSNRSGRSQQGKSSIRRPPSSVFSVTSHRSSRSSNAGGDRKREESFSTTSAKQGYFFRCSASKGIILYARVAVLMFIILNLTNLPFRVNHQQFATSMTIYRQQTIPYVPPESLSAPRFLFGIFSTLRDRDVVRRNVIRRTYLASDTDRICTLEDLHHKPHCRIVYTFVVGANSTGVTDMVDQTPASLVVDAAQGNIFNDLGQPVRPEKDVTYLNLQENMEYGKSPSWFLYANTIVDDLGVDFIAKVDSDTLVFPSRFLDEFVPFLPTKRQVNKAENVTESDLTSELRVYGGIPNDSIGCGGLRRPHCAKMGGKTYMQGQFHFLSVDMSRYVTSIPRDLRHELFVPIEDLCTAKYVHSHPKPVLEAVVSPRQHLWEHGKHIKDPASFERRWNQVVREMQQSSAKGS